VTVRHQILVILWSALLASQVIYLYVAYILPDDPKTDAHNVATMTLALAVVSIAIAVGTLILRRRALVAPIQAGLFDPNSPEGLAKVFTPFMLDITLTESIATNGLVIALISHEPARAYPFAIVAFALMWVHRPWAPDLSASENPGTYRPPAL
jgi:hypothetical protein